MYNINLTINIFQQLGILLKNIEKLHSKQND